MSSFADRVPCLEVTRVYHFSAGHRLASPRLSDEENARLYGPCHRPHGHNYYLEVTVSGSPDGRTGMAVDLAALDRLVESLLNEVDHQMLEEVPALAGQLTTGESLARSFWRFLVGPLGTRLARVTVVETAKNRFEYRGEETAA